MMTSLLRRRSGTKVMPVTANMTPAPRFTRRPNSLTGLGQTELLVNGSGEIVDENGNTVYTAAQVAADPSLINQVSTSVCPAGLLPTWFPGGNVCAGSSDPTEPGPQYDYEVGGQCPDVGWCLTGSDTNDPSAYTWEGGGTPNVPNPATVINAPSLPSSYQGSFTPVTGQALGTPVTQSAVTPPPAASVTQNPAISNALNPPTGASPVTPQSISNGSPQTGNTNTNVGAGANNASGSNNNQAAVTAACPTGETCSILPGIPDNYLYIGGAVVGALILLSVLKN